MTKKVTPQKTPQEKLELAKGRTERAVDLLIDLIHQNENNKRIRSSQISRKIPRSYAVHAYNLSVEVMFDHYLLRLCALWDKADDKDTVISIPQIVKYLNNPIVRSLCEKEITLRWSGRGNFGVSMIKRDVNLIARLCKNCAKVLCSNEIENSINIRNKRLAHNLVKTKEESKGLDVQPVKYKYVSTLLKETITIVDALHMALNGCGFAWNDAQKMARRNAKELWANCSFEIPKR